MEMKMKMHIVCVCGVRLNVSMEQYLKMRCPKCQTMLAQEIERQAVRNSRIVHEMTTFVLNERMTAKRWTVFDEKIARVLAKHEIESHGGTWPPPMAVREQDHEITVSLDEPPTPTLSPLHTMNGVHTGPDLMGQAFPGSGASRKSKTKKAKAKKSKSIKVKIRRKK
jgi:phage FluMu protein Com